MCELRIIGFDGANNAERCVCKPHVINAYNGMLHSGASQKKALEAACRVYCNYHPADTAEDTRLTVERWILATTVH